MSEKIIIEFGVSTDTVGSEVTITEEYTKEQWNAMTESEKESEMLELLGGNYELWYKRLDSDDD